MAKRGEPVGVREGCVGSKGNERDLTATFAVRTYNNDRNDVEGAGSVGNRVHHPSARHYSHNECASNRMDNNNNGYRVSSPLVSLECNVPNDEEDEGASSVTVQARYRLYSPSLSTRASEHMFSTSPPFRWSPSSSLHGDVAQQRFLPGSDRSAPIPVKNAVDCSGFGGGAGRGFSNSYGPAGFSMPPALAGSAPRPQADMRMYSPDREVHASSLHQVGSPPTMMNGAERMSPLLLSISSSYHGDFSPLQSLSCLPPARGGARMGASGAERPRGRKGRAAAAGGAGEGLLSGSGSSADSIPEDLALCPDDDHCSAINDRAHQKKFAHTCRLFPCYHGRIARHAKLFRHAAGQIAQTGSIDGGGGAPKKLPAEALASVNFSSISPEAPNAYRIIVSHGEQSYEIFGDWHAVRVHTFRRYLHQVFKIPPTSQALVRADGDVPLDDDLQSVAHYDVRVDTVIKLRRKEDVELARLPVDEP